MNLYNELKVRLKILILNNLFHIMGLVLHSPEHLPAQAHNSRSLYGHMLY